MKNTLYIPTGLYADDTEKILNILRMAMKRSWQVQRRFSTDGIKAISFERAPDNEILLALSSNTGYGRIYGFWSRIVKLSFFNDKMDANEAKHVLEKFGWNIKLLARGFAIRYMNLNATGTDGLEYNGDPNEAHRRNAEVDEYFKKRFWTRTNGLTIKSLMSTDIIADSRTSGVEPTIADLYFLYEKLIGRLEKSTKRYDDTVVRRLVGEPRDVVSTEAEVARREEIARIKDEYAAKIADMDTNYCYRNGRHPTAYDELQRLIEEFKAKCSLKQKELIAERDVKIAEINDACQFLMV